MNLESARRQMIDQQVRAWEVLDSRVLETLAAVPREAFVPDKYRELAFADTEIPLAHGEVMMPPKLEGRLLQALDLGGDERVLEIGTGSGFVTACLARLARQVDSVEYYQDLSESAAARLADLGIRNVNLDVADGTRIETSRSYDAIAVTGSAPTRLSHLEKLLGTGGRLFIIVGQPPVMEALLVTRVSESAWQCESLLETSLPPLVNVKQPNAFTF